MSTTSLHPHLPTGDPALTLVRTFFSEHADGLCTASWLLGGATAERRSLRLATRVSERNVLSRTDVFDLIETHRLLTLDHVGEWDREETSRFAAIDPMDPRVHDICRLADRLRDLLEALAVGEDTNAAAARAAVADYAA